MSQSCFLQVTIKCLHRTSYLEASIPVARQLKAVSAKSQSNACTELLIWRLLLSKWPNKFEVYSNFICSCVETKWGQNISQNCDYFYDDFIDTSLHVFAEGKCPSPNITNGRAKITGRNQLGAVAKYSCSKGYSLEGVETRVSLTFIYSLSHIWKTMW